MPPCVARTCAVTAVRPVCAQVAGELWEADRSKCPMGHEAILVHRKEPEGKNAKGKNFGKLRGRKKCSRKIFQKISQKIADITFLDIFEIFAEECFLLRSFRKFVPSGFLPLSRFQVQAHNNLGLRGEAGSRGTSNTRDQKSRTISIC